LANLLGDDGFRVEFHIAMRTDDLESVGLYRFGSFAVHKKSDIAARLSQATSEVSADSTRPDH
jgi:hypothetical protein